MRMPLPKSMELMQKKIKPESKESELGMSEAETFLTSGKRKLNLAMIRKLNEVLHIPAEVLIQAYQHKINLVWRGHCFRADWQCIARD